MFIFCYCALYKELAITKVKDADLLLNHSYVTLLRSRARAHTHTHTHTYIYIYEGESNKNLKYVYLVIY